MMASSPGSAGAQSARGAGDELAKLFVFDVRLGTREDNEHEKILFYHPATDSMDKQQVPSRKPAGCGAHLPAECAATCCALAARSSQPRSAARGSERGVGCVHRTPDVRS
jgi:hypothetical protein